MGGKSIFKGGCSLPQPHKITGYSTSCVGFVDEMILSGGGVRMKPGLQRPGQQDESEAMISVYSTLGGIDTLPVFMVLQCDPTVWWSITDRNSKNKD